MRHILLTTEQAQQIEEALEDIVRVFKFETGTPVEALASIRAARAQEQAEQEPIEYLMEVTCSKCGTTESGVLKFKTPQPMKQEPVALPFNCWSTNDGDSWYEHPADAQLIYDTLGDDAKVGDEFEVTAGWTCVTARYRIVSQDDDDFEVECISHPQDNANPVRTKDLTDDDLKKIIRSHLGFTEIAVARAVIAKFKEKNK